MFSKELENLIQATLEDGVLEDYEKAALQKRAQSEGVDLTELEIYINSIMQKRKKEANQKKNAESDRIDKQKKADFGRVCPACGRQITSLALNCVCGYEFKQDKHESSVQLLSKQINQLMAEIPAEDFDNHSEVKQCYKNIATTITTYPVPSTKEDIMDFLALAAPNSKTKGGLLGSLFGRCVALLLVLSVIDLFVIMLSGDESLLVILIPLDIPIFYFTMAYTPRSTINDNIVAKAWRAKFNQVLMKGRSLRADAEFTQMLDYYEKAERGRK